MRYIYQNVVQDGRGNFVASATVTVTLAGGSTKASIYSALTGGTVDADGIITTGTDGTFAFFVDEDDYSHSQQFRIVWSKSGFTSETWDYIQIFPDGDRTILTSSTVDQGDAGITGTIAWHIVDIDGGSDVIRMLPGSYLQETAISIPVGISLIGSGINNTIINSAVSADIAIELEDASPSIYKTELKDFWLLGDAAADAASTGTCGIKVTSTDYTKIYRVRSEGFASGGWGTAGTAGTDEAAGFWVSGAVGVTIENCYATKNDVGFRVDKGGASVNTTTTFKDCLAYINRTHGVLWEDTMTTVWEGGVIESNNGLISFEINCTGAAANNAIKDAHFESNQRISGAAAVGSRDINVTSLATINGLMLENIQFGSGATYPETIVELADTLLSTMRNCFFSLGAGGTNTLELNTDAVSTILEGNYFSTYPTDNGVGTVFVDRRIGVNDSADLASDTPSVSGVIYAKGYAGTMTSLANGSNGQIVIIEGQAGTTLDSSDNFLLKNGGSYMVLADGSIVTLRKDKTSGKWVLIGHEPSVAAQSLTNTATPSIDDRKIVYVPDAAVTAITSINGGYEGQDVFFVSEHTGANTTTFTDGGNLTIAGDFAMGLGDVLHLVYRKSTNKWHEVSRSAN